MGMMCLCVYTLVESKGVVSSLLYLFFILFVLLLTCKLSQVVHTRYEQGESGSFQLRLLYIASQNPIREKRIHEKNLQVVEGSEVVKEREHGGRSLWLVLKL